jgi:hypothetical protein
MTTETVQSMGDAVLAECFGENCVITLGSKIGADYIVRGTIGKFQKVFTLEVETYETDNVEMRKRPFGKMKRIIFLNIQKNKL